MTLVTTYWSALAGHRRRSAAFVALIALAGVFEALSLAMLVPLLEAVGEFGDASRTFEVMGRTFTQQALRTAALAAFLAFGTVAAACRLAGEATGIRVLARCEESMRRDITAALLQAEWSAYQKLRLGDVASSALVVAAQVASGALQFLRALGTMAIAVSLAVAATLTDWRLSLFTLGFGVLLVMAYRVSGRRAEAHARELAESSAMIGRDIADIFGNLKFFRSTGNTSRSLDRTYAVYRRFAHSYFRSQLYGPMMRFAFEAGALLFVGAIFIVTLGLTDGRITPESVTFVAIFYRLAPRMQQSQEYLQAARMQKPWFEDWRERLAVARAAEQPRWDGVSPSYARTLVFHDVVYAFPGMDQPVIDRVSWELRQGQCIAFVGESGSGKSTMLDLVTGLLRPTSGSVRVDGVDLRTVDVEQWQSRIGLVTQDAPLLFGTVLENIRWTEAHEDRDWAWRCLEAANAKAFVEALPQGLDTPVGERGGRFSGGQRQRLALARALYRRPWLLVLDEATSALDNESELAVRAALNSIKGSCAMIIVAHRLATVAIADTVHVLQQGRIVQSGTWPELQVAAGPFSEMAASERLPGEENG